MSNTATTTSNGIGFFSALTLIFGVLKLTGVIAWSWWWVISPILIHMSLVFLAIIGLVALRASKK